MYFITGEIFEPILIPSTAMQIDGPNYSWTSEDFNFSDSSIEMGVPRNRITQFTDADHTLIRQLNLEDNASHNMGHARNRQHDYLEDGGKRTGINLLPKVVDRRLYLQNIRVYDVNDINAYPSKNQTTVYLDQHHCMFIAPKTSKMLAVDIETTLVYMYRRDINHIPLFFEKKKKKFNRKRSCSVSSSF